MSMLTVALTKFVEVSVYVEVLVVKTVVMTVTVVDACGGVSVMTVDVENVVVEVASGVGAVITRVVLAVFVTTLVVMTATMPAQLTDCGKRGGSNAGLPSLT
jgi:hypothetical protein